MPVRFAASAFASSKTSRGNMQLSTTTIAISVPPSLNTNALANNGSTSRSAVRSSNIPFTMTGYFAGVTSIANAPTRSPRSGTGAAASTAYIWQTPMQSISNNRVPLAPPVLFKNHHQSPRALNVCISLQPSPSAPSILNPQPSPPPLLLLRRPKIQHPSLLSNRHNLRHKLFVGLTRRIFPQPLGIIKRKHERMREPLIMRLRAIILPPLKCLHCLTLRPDLLDGRYNVLHLRLTRTLLELQKQRMLQLPILPRLLRLPPIITDEHLIQMRT